MPQDTPVTVQIFNQTYRVISESEDPNYIQKAAAYLDQKMNEAASGSAPRPLQIAILAAMNIAEEVLLARKNTEGLMSDADQRISNFTRFLEDRIESGSSPQEDAEDPPTRRF